MQQLGELVRFLPALGKKGPKAGSWIVPGEIEPSVHQMPYVRYDDIAQDFIACAYDHGWVLQEFDWLQWSQSNEAVALRDDESAIAQATPEQLARLLTAIIRQDRFSEGALLEALESGLILRIVRRAEAILRSENELPQT